MTISSPLKQPPSRTSPEVLDLLLIDIAIRMQISRTEYQKAENRYKALNKWIDRQDSPLRGKVELLYTQGSMAIGTTIASRLTTDEYDVDIVAQLALGTDTSPQTVLELLFESIRGEPNSQYYDMVELRSRCVTVHYADKMHVDITPMIRMSDRPERESLLFHNKHEDPTEPSQTLIANPYGFADWFNEKTQDDHKFAIVFEGRANDYEQRIFAADTDDLPDQEPTYQKSKAVIVLQLMKRWRNILFSKRDNRPPPSVLMSKLVADVANNTTTLSEELLCQARAMRDKLSQCHQARQFIEVVNPICTEDVLTDRWPGSFKEQGAFVSDLNNLVEKVEALISDCDLEEIQRIMTELFGETPTRDVILAFNERMGKEVRDTCSQYQPNTGKRILPAMVGVGGAMASEVARPIRKHTFYGGGGHEQ